MPSGTPAGIDEKAYWFDHWPRIDDPQAILNGKRILLAGLAAGVAMDVMDVITNAVIFGSRWSEAYKALGLPGQNPAIPAFWLTFDLFAGVIVAWLYAAMRPRFGAGPRTAIYAAFVQWLLVHLTLYSHLADGVFPAQVLIGTSMGELVSSVVGGLIAVYLYQENVETVSAKSNPAAMRSTARLDQR